MTFLYGKNQIFVRPARAGDGFKLAGALRAADRAELALSHPGRGAGELLEEFIARSAQSYWVERKGEPAALFGAYAPCFLARRACVWLLTGRSAAKMPVTFFKLARAAVYKMLAVWPELYNFTDGRYLPAVRFIKRLGGEFDGSFQTFGGVRFLYFTFRRNIWEESQVRREEKFLPL